MGHTPWTRTRRSRRVFARSEERLLSPEVRRSATAAGDLLADEFVEFGSSGRIFDRQEIIDALRAETSMSERSVLGLRLNVLAPKVGLVTYRLGGPDGSGAISPQSLRSSIWKLIGEHWQLVFHPGTPSLESRR